MEKKLELLWNLYCGKEKVSNNRGHKIMKHFKILEWFDSPQVKWYMKSSTKSIVCELPHDLRWTGICAHTRKKSSRISEN